MAKAFMGGSYSSFLTNLLLAMSREINAEDEDKFLSYDREQYLDFLEDRYSQDGVQTNWDEANVSEVRDGSRAVSKNATPVRYHVPISGDATLLTKVPGRVSFANVDVNVSANEYSFDLVATGDGSMTRHQANQVRNIVESNLAVLMEEREAFNKRLRAQASEAFDARKRAILQKTGLIQSLGVPSNTPTP